MTFVVTANIAIALAAARLAAAARRAARVQKGTPG